MRIRPRGRTQFKWDVVSFTTILLYGIAILACLTAVFTSPEAGTVSISFLLAGVVVPFLGLGIAFALQTLAQRHDMFRELFRVTEQSRLMKIFEDILSPQLAAGGGGSNPDARQYALTKVMYEKLIHDIESKLLKLRDLGLVEAFDNYWDFCAAFYATARNFAECTSIIPIADYNRPDMQRYLAMQRNELIAHGVPVSRTFVFRTRPENADEVAFRTLCFSQASQGFRLYFIILDEVSLSEEDRELLFQDFAFIGSDIVQLGSYSIRTAQKVLYY